MLFMFGVGPISCSVTRPPPLSFHHLPEKALSFIDDNTDIGWQDNLDVALYKNCV